MDVDMLTPATSNMGLLDSVSRVECKESKCVLRSLDKAKSKCDVEWMTTLRVEYNNLFY